jgi:hypothetical protein
MKQGKCKLIGKDTPPCGADKYCDRVIELPPDKRSEGCRDSECELFVDRSHIPRAATMIYLDIIRYETALPGFVRKAFNDGIFSENDVCIIGAGKGLLGNG